jgi:hypothetical protein
MIKGTKNNLWYEKNVLAYFFPGNPFGLQPD